MCVRVHGDKLKSSFINLNWEQINPDFQKKQPNKESKIYESSNKTSCEDGQDNKQAVTEELNTHKAIRERGNSWGKDTGEQNSTRQEDTKLNKQD